MGAVGMSEWRSFDSKEQLDAQLAKQVALNLREDIGLYGSASLAVSGGNTPKNMFHQLSLCEIQWSKVDITLVDERWVDPGNEDSNERLVRECLLQNEAVAAQFYGLKTSCNDATGGLVAAGEGLAHVRRPFSIVILGVGGDGHTASWFPRASNLNDLLDPEGEAELAVCDPVTAPYQRITLTFPAVLNARNIFIHIVGEEKKKVLREAVDVGTPISEILKQATTPVTIWWAA